MLNDDHETSLLDEGDQIIEQKVTTGCFSLSPRARMIYCVWAAE